MKYFIQVMGACLLFSLNYSCIHDVCNETQTFIRYTPVYIQPDSLRIINVEGPRVLVNPGKIYVYHDYLFISETYKGIHIYDNSNKQNPTPISFLSIPGNVDMAVRNGFLYADNYLDLMSFDLKDPANPRMIQELRNAFVKDRKAIKNKGFLIYYKPTLESIQVDCSDSYFGQDEIFLANGDMLLNSKSGSQGRGGYNSGNQQVNSNGIGGSMARFTLVNDRLYIIDKTKLHIYNVAQAGAPSYINSTTVKRGSVIETIFPYKNHLFIGSDRGMYIYDNRNPDLPVFVSEFEHARACDPVYVQGDIAYVTLRNGTRCRGFVNQLDVIDITSLQYPKLIKSYPMSNPQGLTVLGDRMILCEGTFGLRLLDVRNPKGIRTISKITDKHFYDAIGLSRNHIILTGNNGIYQYKLQDDTLIELSFIKVKKP